MMYFYSPKLSREIKEIAELSGDYVQHLGGMNKIRWIASRTRTLQALAKNYPLMVTHLEHLASRVKK